MFSVHEFEDGGLQLYVIYFHKLIIVNFCVQNFQTILSMCINFLITAFFHDFIILNILFHLIFLELHTAVFIVL